MTISRPFLNSLVLAISLTGTRLPAQTAITHADAAPVWGSSVVLKSVATIGALDGPPEYAFGSVDHIAGERNGSFFLFDSKYTQIRHYSAAGKLIANIGAKGSGPGEYQGLLGMAILGDTALVTWDPRNARVTFFSLDGKVRSSFLPTLGGITYAANAFGVDNAGTVSLLSRVRSNSAYIRYRPNGTLLDTLIMAEPISRGFVLLTADGARFSFGQDQLARLNPSGGLITATTSTLGFTTSIGGKPVTVQRTFTPVRLGAEERQEWQTYADFLFARAKAQPSRPGVIMPEPALANIPAAKPALRDLFATRDGRVWLDVYTAAEKRNIPPRPAGDARPQITWRERSSYDVFTATGQFLGRVTLPADHELLDAHGDRIWTLTKGPDDEERVEVFQIMHQ